LPVTNYPQVNGQTVYLDKYEITAGRMRAFINAVVTSQGGNPNGPVTQNDQYYDVKSYMAAHRPARWNMQWEAVLPSAYYDNQPAVVYQIKNPTPTPAQSDPLGLYGYLYPGPDVVPGKLYNLDASPMTVGSLSIYPGIFETFGEQDFFPEYTADSAYGATHNLNCSNAAGSYGFGTYWLPAGGNINRGFPQADMDSRALNCTTNAMFAAFCAWDGGQLVTEDVMTYVVGGTTWSPSAGGGSGYTCTGATCRIGAPGADCNGYNLKSDSAGACTALPPYEGNGTTTDDSGRIFPPGSIAADVVRIVNTDEGWYDLKGNLLEMVVSADDRFAYNGYGIGYASITHHRGQVVTARFKEGSTGARCMRLK